MQKSASQPDLDWAATAHGCAVGGMWSRSCLCTLRAVLKGSSAQQTFMNKEQPRGNMQSATDLLVSYKHWNEQIEAHRTLLEIPEAICVNPTVHLESFRGPEAM